MSTLSGHYWTVAGHVRRALRRSEPSNGRPWRLDLDDPQVEGVRLTGTLRNEGAKTLAVLIHGLGGCNESGYALAAAAAAERAGLASLALNLRGSDRQGADFYHGGLTEDLHAMLASPEVQAYERILLLGFSLGGHQVLKALGEGVDPRVRAAAAVCSPLDLATCADAIDRPSGWVYRRYLLRRLSEIYEAVAALRDVPVPVERVRRVRYIREFDDLVIAPRHGFAGAADYYARASAGPWVARLTCPTLLLLAEPDPMVPAASVRPFLDQAPPALEVRWVDRAGHVAFPRRLGLGMGAEPGLYGQVLGWLKARI